jgi:hypothetical protein
MIALRDIENVEVAALADEAGTFLAGQPWCDRIGTGWLSFAIPGVLGIFLFEVVGRTDNVPPTVWVVVGDLPSAYIVQSADAGWQDVLAGYVFEMRRWVTAVESSSSVSELIPVGVAPTHEHAKTLASRLDFIQSDLLDQPADSIEGTDA